MTPCKRFAMEPIVAVYELQAVKESVGQLNHATGAIGEMHSINDPIYFHCSAPLSAPPSERLKLATEVPMSRLIMNPPTHHSESCMFMK